jgi:hypothetical protein
VPDEHRRQIAVEYDVARIEIIGEQAATEVSRDDHPDSGKFLVAELADFASRIGHEQTLVCYTLIPFLSAGCEAGERDGF